MTTLEGVNEIVASAGTGAEVLTEQITNRVKFWQPKLRKHGLHAHLCRIVKVTGESMERTLLDGARRTASLGRLFAL